MRATDQLVAHYQDLERRFPVTLDPTFEKLVVPNGNGSRPFHRWFHVKEGFSCDLFEAVLKELELDQVDQLKVADPFVGGGTTVTSALDWALTDSRQVQAIGIERNPFLSFLARTKVDAAQSAGEWIAEEVELLVQDALERLASSPSQDVERPVLSTFHNREFFNGRRLNNLLRLRDAIAESHYSDLARRIGLVGVSSIIEAVGNLRRDGRALRYVERNLFLSVAQLFREHMERFIEDIRMTPSVGAADVLLGDGRKMNKVVGEPDNDVILFSPPYPNNIDYTEVYKLEGWLLQFYSDERSFREQRKRTLRSHPSVIFDNRDEDAEAPEISKLVEPLVNCIPQDKYRHQRRRMIEGYFVDLDLTLRAATEIVRDGGFVVVVVGNSLHGQGSEPLVIAADLLIAHLGELAGFKVKKIIEARRPQRRGRHPFLRESLVLFKADK